MSFTKIILGTSKSPLLSVPSSIICAGVAGMLPIVGVCFILSMFTTFLLLVVVTCVRPEIEARLSRLRPWLRYRLPILFLGAICLGIGVTFIAQGDCPSPALKAFGGTAPMILGAISGAQCAVAICLDVLRWDRVWSRQALSVALIKRTLRSRALSAPFGGASR